MEPPVPVRSNAVNARFHCVRYLGAQLQDGIDLGEVRDVLWNYRAIDHYERLTLSRGRSLERCSRGLAEAITSALCPR
jgi:hypothetical protein